MKNLAIFSYLFFFPFGFLTAQTTQWATKLVAFSSQYDNQFYGARQVLGPPNAMDNYSDSPFSWASAGSENPEGEFLHVEFDEAMQVQQFAIAESLNPGAIDQVFLYDTDGNEHLVYQQTTLRPIYSYRRLFTKKIPLTPYKVIGLKVTLNTVAIKGMNQIDAIAISDDKKQIQPEIKELKYSTIVPYPENLGAGVNSEFSEHLPIISPDGQTLYFARKGHPENFGGTDNDDIWYSRLEADGMWGVAQNIGTPLNNERHNFVVAVGENGELLYLQNAYKKRSKDGISVAKFVGGAWQMPQIMPISNMYNLNEFTAYHVSYDGNFLLMAIEREDSYGDRDLYVSFKQKNGEWSEPLNLGKTINTLGMESSVFLAADNKTLYFSSAGFAGYGGLDMYIARRLDDTWTNWSEPLNLGLYINTPGNDYNYTLPAFGEYAYFASDFKGYGQSDLFRIKLPKEALPEPVQLAHNQPIIEFSDTISIEIGKTITLPNISFATNDSTLQSAAFEVLNQLALWLRQHDTLVVEIAGHTNGWCSDDFAAPLSKSRAAAVIRYLTEKGIEPRRLHAKGYGKARPIASDETKEGRQLNQRVELKILEVE